MNAVRSRKTADSYNTRIDRLVAKIESSRERRWLRRQIREQSRFGYYEFSAKHTYIKFDRNMDWLCRNGYKIIRNNNEKGLKIEW